MKTLFKRTILAGLLLCMTSSLFAQQKVTIDVKDEPLKKVVSELSRITGYEFIFSDSFVDVSQKVNISVSNGSLADVLDLMIKGTDINYSILDNKVVFSQKKSRAYPETAKEETVNGITVSGRVIDMSGEPVIGAAVLETGTSNGEITDYNGEFFITIGGSGAVLDIQALGYEPYTVAVKSDRKLTVTLREDKELIEEAVVVGYGTMRKRDLTGSVSQVKMEEAMAGTVSTISHALAGKAAGLQVNQTSAIPGASVSFRIRGAASPTSNDPLIIIDGFPVDPHDDSSYEIGYYASGSTDNILGSINPNDIASIEVLKDASATAIYGSRAGHGVIIITTKKGSAGKAKVSYSGTGSVQVMTDNYETLSSREVMQEANKLAYEEWMQKYGIGIYGGKAENQASKPYQPYFSKIQINNPEYDTDWFDEVTRMGWQTQHNLSVTGGNDKTKYLVSGNYFHQEGVIKTNALSRYTGRINLEQKLGRVVTFGINTTFTRNETDNVPVGSGQNENASLLVSASKFSPLFPVRDENGDYSLNPYLTYIPNPVSLLEITNKTTKNRVLGTAYVEVKPIEELSLKANFGVDYNNAKHKVYMPKTTLYGKKKNGQADMSQMEKNDYLFELTANYNKKLGEHNVNALAGYSFQQFNKEGLWLGNSDFLTDAFIYNNMGAGQYVKPTVGSNATKREVASFFGRVNYSYKDRYLLTATVRADGTSDFAPGNRWGYFPSVSAGWVFTDEPFMESLKSWWSMGKVRLSYGQTGNANIGYQVESYYARSDKWDVYSHSFGETEHMGLLLSQLGNPDLTWETTSEWNVGLELGFFNDRLSLTAEYFNRVISDLLSWRTLSKLQELEGIADNVGKTQSQGFELTINTQNIKRSSFSWTTDFTFSLYRDRWLERAESWVPKSYSIYDGPLRLEAGYVSDGLVQAGETISYMPGAIPGQVKIKDIDGFLYDDDGNYVVNEHGIFQKTGRPDGRINEADMVIYGSKDPDFIMGLNNTFNWKNFDLNVYFYGQFGLLNSGSYKEIWIGNLGNLKYGITYPDTAKDVYRHDNQDSVYPGYFANKSSYGYGDYLLKKLWFIRCRNITLGYTVFPKKGLSKLRVYFDVNNPFIIQPGYSGFDLETDDSSWAYPNSRSFSLGLDITF